MVDGGFFARLRNKVALRAGCLCGRVPSACPFHRHPHRGRHRRRPRQQPHAHAATGPFSFGHVVPSAHGPGLGHALVSSVALNLAEGTGRFGRDRLHHYRIAYGSCQEAKTTVEILVLSGNLFIRSLSFPPVAWAKIRPCSRTQPAVAGTATCTASAA